ncbi:MAG TPA: hypothetical protein VF682_19885 [Pseudomonas sp.]|jgi:hypothetical protein
MKLISKLFLAAGLLTLLAGCGGDDSPVVKAKTIDDVGNFIEKDEQLTPGQKKDLAIAVPNLMNEWVIKHGYNEDIKKDLGSYFDGMHVNEIIKKGGTKPNLGARADAESIAREYRAKH